MSNFQLIYLIISRFEATQTNGEIKQDSERNFWYGLMLTAIEFRLQNILII